MGGLVSVQAEAGVHVVTIDNPPVNAFHPDVGEALLAAFDAIAAAQPPARAVVLTGAGRFFMAGGDIRHFQTLDEISAERYARRIQIIQEVIFHFPCPVIAAVNGSALGGGCELMMACDIRIAAVDALFGQPEVTLGIIPGAGGTQNLPRLVPVGTAKRLLFTGDRISAIEAQQIGLVDEVVATADLLPHAMALARRIAKNAPLAVSAAKQAINLGLELGLAEALRLETSLFAKLFRSRDVSEGVAAFLEKRPADFHGK
ncbi:MAG: enoyl-CoA hydratase/isomerase family protein [Sphingomonadales bacterium]|nr:MAG: enoyl-CoA hydratase/isomerase family protein [Sphingomonadales bacterium]